jgi:hypothetical protein
MKFSVVVPCYNQGHFLIDCLESLAVQARRPDEVLVVNDGSTDAETLALFARLLHYAFPYPLRVLDKPNGGLSSARNHGARHSRGDVVLPLDSDDKLFPDALAEYDAFLADRPDVDICYPDMLMFGNLTMRTWQPAFNPWRLAQQNILLCSSAIRRRVFEAGYWYDESMKEGYEDWEFYVRTCAVGPFRAAPLKKCVFAYRKWGFSMYSACNHDNLVARIRERHTPLGWSAPFERALRTRSAPSHRLLVPAGAVAPAAGDDLAPLVEADLEGFLAGDYVSRFLWVGRVPPDTVPSLQFILGQVSARFRAAVFLFCRHGEDRPYLTVHDRLTWLLLHPYFDPTPTLPQRVVRISTAGRRHAWLVSVSDEQHSTSHFHEWALRLPNLLHRSLLPRGWRLDPRLENDLHYFFHRDPAVPCPAVLGANQRVLVVAARTLSCAEVESPLRDLLEHDRLRERFDRVYLLTFESHDGAGHEFFDPLVDGVYSLAHPLIAPGQQLALATAVLDAARAGDLLVVNAPQGYDLLPHLKQAKMRVRIAALFHDAREPQEEGGEALAYGRLVASSYASVFHRVASFSTDLTDHLTGQYYFPRSKIKTILYSNDRRSPFDPPAWPLGEHGSRRNYAATGDLISWLFPAQGGATANPFGAVFGSGSAA